MSQVGLVRSNNKWATLSRVPQELFIFPSKGFRKVKQDHGQIGVGHGPAAARARDALELEEELEHRAARELGIEAEVLREESEAGPHVAGVGDDVGAVEEHRAGRRLDEPGHWNRTLSLGEQQRLGIARALLHAPQYLFLDEATASLDEPSTGRDCTRSFA